MAKIDIKIPREGRKHGITAFPRYWVMAQSHETAQSSILSKTEEQIITEQTINRNFNSRK